MHISHVLSSCLSNGYTENWVWSSILTWNWKSTQSKPHSLKKSKILNWKIAFPISLSGNLRKILGLNHNICLLSQLAISKLNTRWKRPSRKVSTTPLWQKGFRICLPFSWTTLRGKHCQHPIVVMRVVDTLVSAVHSMMFACLLDDWLKPSLSAH